MAGKYRAMAEVDKEPRRADFYRRLVSAELRHARVWADKLGIDPNSLQPDSSGFRIRMCRLAARVLGAKRVAPWFLRGEMNGARAYAADPEAKEIARENRRHHRLLREMLNDGDRLAALRSNGGFAGNSGSLRAAVLGVNDGLVSNFSLVMGVAGGSSNADFVLLAGIAGLLAGAFSMAAGEYVSMRSQRDVYEHQIGIEKMELEDWPDEEEEELVLIYRSKGLSEPDARRVAQQIMKSPQIALETMVREELGLDPDELGSPWGAAISSFTAFVGGAIVPILPYIFNAGGLAFTLSAVLSAAALLTVGGLLSGLSSKSPVWGALRMLLAGGAAAAVTFGIGHAIGVSVAG